MKTTFDGYDPHSPTLRPSAVVGDCMRGIIDDSYVTYWYDSAPPIYSGDLVRLGLKYPDFTAFVVKQLRVTRCGRWFGRCADGVFPIGHMIVPASITKIVALDTKPCMSSPSWDTYRPASPDQARMFAQLVQPAVKEWEQFGHIDGVPFPGLHVVNHCLADGSPNPQFRRPQRLTEYSNAASGQ